MRPELRLPARLLNPTLGSAGLLAAVASYVALLLTGVGGETFDQIRDVGFYNALLVVSALFCLARPARQQEARLAWLLVGLGLLAWVIGDLYWEFAFADLDEVPFPSVADAFYLTLYPLVYAGLVLLLKSRLQDIRADLWLDGVIAGLSIAGLGAALVFGVFVEATGGDPITVATNLAYPIADLGLIGVVVVVLGITGWKIDRAWGCVLAGCVVFGVADTGYLYQTAKGTYVQGTIVDAGWVAGIALIAIAAWQPRRAVVAVRVEGLWAFAFPTIFGTVALGTLVYDHFRPVNTVALALTTCAVGAVIVRMAMTFRRNTALLDMSRRDAETDTLTGLANRRRLLSDLEARIEAGVPTIFLLFDLNGFKSYNDAFGHPAGDSLLHRLAGRLGEAAKPYGRAYRMGGDEFCVIADGDAEGRGPIVVASLRALHDEGEGFQISSAYGAVVLPGEAHELSEALRIADTRLYGNKDSRRASASRQTREVLLSALYERDSSFRGHLSAVVQLARAPALARIAPTIRSTHERIDGMGYPDGLAGDDIPLLSRIIAVCDAFYAMTEGRPHRPAVSDEHAMAELRRCSGAQFDRAVVDALVDTRREQQIQLVA